MRVLLAVDPSPDSRRAAQVVKHLAAPPDLHLLHVVDMDALKHAYEAPAMPQGAFEAYRREVAEVAERTLHEAGAELAPFAADLRLIADTGDAAESIIQTAEDLRADLVVLGQRGMTATPAFLLGGVSQKVATYAPCSVLVVKEPPAAPLSLLLAVDGSEASTAAVRFLAMPPFKGRLPLAAVTVWPSQWFARAGASEEAEAARSEGEGILRRATALLPSGAYEVETEWLEGDPALAILEAASRRRAQMIVVGARGRTAVKRFFLGSVSQKVLVYAACSVLIVR